MSALALRQIDDAPFELQRLREHLVGDPTLAATCASAAFIAVTANLTARQALDLVDGLRLPPGSLAKINLYKTWLGVGRDTPALTAIIWFNLATDYDAFGDGRNKVTALQNALAVHSGCYQAATNLGLTFEAHQQADKAVAIWNEALQSDDARVMLLNNVGRVHENQKRLAQAKAAYTRSLLTQPEQPPVLHHLIGLRQKICDWPIYRADLPGVTPAAMIAATRALTLLAINDDIAAQRQGNESWIAEKMPVVASIEPPREPRSQGRIRVGYLSSDFCMHPIGYLIAELLEAHDREAFDVYGFCSTAEDNSEIRLRIRHAFDTFVGVRDLGDAETAALMRAHEIDVLIDLNGLTLGNRLQVLRWRPAPIQMTYLGYNGPIPLPELDYIIADRFVIPETSAAAYHPAPLYMPQCFQVNDTKLPIRTDVTRRDVGLPEDRFVFCCFSNTYKITQAIFEAWMTILARCEEAVLWLYVDNDEAMANLGAVARRHGVDIARIIFAPRVEASLYRGRLALADLFLDTFPYNAGTTASDALRVGLPLITLSGESFISRMAGSLLTTMDLADCIVSTIEDYIDLAVRLATEPDAYGALRARVEPRRWAETLGDTAGFCRALEAALVDAIGRRQTGTV